MGNRVPRHIGQVALLMYQNPRNLHQTAAAFPASQAGTTELKVTPESGRSPVQAGPFDFFVALTPPRPIVKQATAVAAGPFGKTPSRNPALDQVSLLPHLRWTAQLGVAET